MRNSELVVSILCVGLSLQVGCEQTGEQTVGAGDRVKTGDGKSDSSVEAVFVDFEFDGELIATSSFNARAKIQDQLLFTIGHLNGDRGVGRLDQLNVTNIQTTPIADGNVRINYHARLPVAWGKRNSVPTEYALSLPHHVGFAAQEEFTEKYKESCVDFSAHDVDSGSMWYYYRPNAWNCTLEADDIFVANATVTLSTINTTGKYPEYDKVWEDDTLRVVAVFGKYEDGATENSDAGIAAYNTFVTRMVGELSSFQLTTLPAVVPSNPGIAAPDITFSAVLPDGRAVEVVALLVDNVRTAGPTFNSRYEALSTRADMIAYNGHAGLGANIRALAQKGKFVTGQYVMVFMNGCDTYAYVDSALLDAHAAVNPDDPIGTKYVDMVTNALPAFFHSTAGASLSLIRGLLSYDEPMTYEQMFQNIDSAQVVLVSGEQDNTFVPGGGTPTDLWEGLSESGTVAADEEHRFETPVLPAGSYAFTITGTSDADLYVRIGAAPTTGTWDCRPFKTGSDEVCVATLPAPASIHVMVRGWNASSNYSLEAAAQ